MNDELFFWRYTSLPYFMYECFFFKLKKEIEKLKKMKNNMESGNKKRIFKF